MATEAPPRLMTIEEFLALPDEEGVDRMLLRGEVWEQTMTRRNRFHSATEAAIAYHLSAWLRSQPRPQGQVFSGEVGVRLVGEAPSVVGIDVAYYGPDRLVTAEAHESSLLSGPPTLAVEILSPSDRIEEIQAKLDVYLASGVPVVLMVDPHFKTVTVYRPDQGPELCHGKAALADETHLPGLRIAVAELFPERP